MQRIRKDNGLMLQRLVNGKSSFSVTNWEKQHKNRQKLLQKFGVYPYILDKKSNDPDFDRNETYLSAWQSSTKIEDD